MTTKQAEDINTKFLRMKDSIALLKEQVSNSKDNNLKLSKTNYTLLDSIKNTNIELKDNKNNLNWYRKENEEYRESLIILTKEHKKTIFALTVSAAIFTSAVVLLAKNL